MKYPWTTLLGGLLLFVCAISSMNIFEREREKNKHLWKCFEPGLCLVCPIPFDSITEPSEIIPPNYIDGFDHSMAIIQYIPYKPTLKDVCEKHVKRSAYLSFESSHSRLYDPILFPWRVLKHCVNPYIYYKRHRYIYKLTENTWFHVEDGPGAWDTRESNESRGKDDWVIENILENKLIKCSLIDTKITLVYPWGGFITGVLPDRKLLFMVRPGTLCSMRVPQKVYDCYINFE